MPARILLTATSGDLAGQTFALPAPARYSLGRSRDCSVCLPAHDLFVSRHHCLLEVEPDAVVIRDLGSLNGTFLNGRYIGGRGEGDGEEGRRAVASGGDPRSLTPGDELQIGHSVFRVAMEA